MGRIKNREQALRTILRVPDVPVLEDFPPTATLPPVITEYILRAVKFTAERGFVLSSSFRYNATYDRWRGGKVLLGTGLHDAEGLITQHPHRLSHLPLKLYRPHIAFQTRIAMDSPDVQAEVEQMLQAEQLIEVERRYRQASYLAPTPKELALLTQGGGGTVGNIVASAAGTLLLLRSDVSIGSILSGRVDHDMVERYQSGLDTIDRQAPELDTEAARQQVLATTAEALQSLCACYFSNDIESPELELVSLGSQNADSE